jgi:hypothetical protein
MCATDVSTVTHLTVNVCDASLLVRIKPGLIILNSNFSYRILLAAGIAENELSQLQAALYAFLQI